MARVDGALPAERAPASARRHGPPMQAMAGLDLTLMLRQARHSWYILFNQLPFLPERAHERLIRKLWR